MRKFLFLFLFCLVNMQIVFASDDMSVVPMNGRFNIKYNQTDSSLIDTKNMKDKDKAEIAKEKALQNEKQKIYVDKMEITRQRALDYIDRQNNAFMPSF